MSDSDNSLRRIQALVGRGWVVFTTHAREEMVDEMTSPEEVCAAILGADSCEQSTGVTDRWVVGCSELGLIAVCAMRSDVVVVTVFGRSQHTP